MSGRIFRDSYPTTKSHTRASPQVGCKSVPRILMVVVLPAPFGPMNPKQSPSLISRFRFDSATSVPYRLVRLTVLITADIRELSSIEHCTGSLGRGRLSDHASG